MSMFDLFRKLRAIFSTHDCPTCKGPAYCAMEDGKSASLCWCMQVEQDNKPELTGSLCSCRRCLTKK